MNIKEGRQAYIDLWTKQAKLQYVGGEVSALSRLDLLLAVIGDSTVADVKPIWPHAEVALVKWVCDQQKTTGKYSTIVELKADAFHFFISEGGNYTQTTDLKVAAFIINNAIGAK